MKSIDISIIIPCYNEGPTFEKSVKQIVQVLEKIRENFEIIFIDDRSTDATKKSVEKLVHQIKNSKVIFHLKNEGRGKSVSDGINASSAPICGYLDVDCEISPSYIPLFIEDIRNGSDMVVGRRFYEKDVKSLGRVIASQVYAKIVKTLLDIPIEDTEAGYKFFNKLRILPILAKTKDNRWFWDTEICARAFWAGLKINQLPVLFKKRSDKKSTVRLMPDTFDYLIKIIKFRKNLPAKNKI